MGSLAIWSNLLIASGGGTGGLFLLSPSPFSPSPFSPFSLSLFSFFTLSLSIFLPSPSPFSHFSLPLFPPSRPHVPRPSGSVTLSLIFPVRWFWCTSCFVSVRNCRISLYPATQKVIHSKTFEILSVCPSVHSSALRFRTLTWVVFDRFSSNFAWTLISGRSGLGLQMGLICS